MKKIKGAIAEILRYPSFFVAIAILGSRERSEKLQQDKLLGDF
ncbi:MAG: hypothetical protein VKL41_04420 [Snowella sp.]|nr:hypothetical protein [Snowella sp.]